MRRLLFLAAIVLLLVGAVRPVVAPTAFSDGAIPPAGIRELIARPDLRADPRVRAFLQAYGPLLDEVTFLEDDAVFSVGGKAILFQDGKMLGEERLNEAEQHDPFFYPYSLDPLSEPLRPDDNPVRSTDVLELLFGRTESEIRRRCESVKFLDRRLFLNSMAVEPLHAVGYSGGG